MKKSFKILSFLVVAVAAFITSFTFIRVNGADTLFEYSDNNLSITQEGSTLDIILYVPISLNDLNPETSYLKFLDSQENEKTFLFDDASGFNVENDVIYLSFDADIYVMNELIEYKIYNNSNELIVEYLISEEGGETMGGFITQIFETLGDIISGFSTLLVSLFENVVKIFYTAPTGSETIGSLTVVGVLTLVAMGCGLVIWGFKFLRSLIRVKTK